MAQERGQKDSYQLGLHHLERDALRAAHHFFTFIESAEAAPENYRGRQGDLADAHNQLGVLYFVDPRAQDKTEAEAFFLKAAEIGCKTVPNVTPELQCAIARLLEQKNPEAAIQWIMPSARTYAPAAHTLGVIYQENGKKEEAAEWFEVTLKCLATPTLSEKETFAYRTHAHYQLGVIYQALGKELTAAKHLLLAHRYCLISDDPLYFDPNEASPPEDLLLQKEVIEDQLNNFSFRLTCVGKLTTHASNLLKEGKTKEALQAMGRTEDHLALVLRQRPTNLLSWSEELQQQYEDVSLRYVQILRGLKRSAVKENLAHVEYTLGKIEASRTALPSGPETNYEFGMYYLENQEPDKAKRYLELAFKQQYTDARFPLALLYLREADKKNSAKESATKEQLTQRALALLERSDAAALRTAALEDQGQSDVHYQLALLLEKKPGASQQTFAFLDAAVEAKHAGALCKKGEMLLLRPETKAQGADLLLAAAKQKESRAYWVLGNHFLLEEGKGGYEVAYWHTRYVFTAEAENYGVRTEIEATEAQNSVRKQWESKGPGDKERVQALFDLMIQDPDIFPFTDGRLSRDTEDAVRNFLPSALGLSSGLIKKKDPREAAPLLCQVLDEYSEGARHTLLRSPLVLRVIEMVRYDFTEPEKNPDWIKVDSYIGMAKLLPPIPAVAVAPSAPSLDTLQGIAAQPIASAPRRGAIELKEGDRAEVEEAPVEGKVLQVERQERVAVLKEVDALLEKRKQAVSEEKKDVASDLTKEAAAHLRSYIDLLWALHLRDSPLTEEEEKFQDDVLDRMDRLSDLENGEHTPLEAEMQTLGMNELGGHIRVKREDLQGLINTKSPKFQDVLKFCNELFLYASVNLEFLVEEGNIVEKEEEEELRDAGERALPKIEDDDNSPGSRGEISPRKRGGSSGSWKEAIRAPENKGEPGPQPGM